MIILLSGILFAQGGSISGKTLDKDNGSALIAANVIVTGSALKTPTGGATDVEGFYSVHNLPAGEYTLRVNYIGYEQIEKKVTLDSEQHITVNFQLLTDVIKMETYVVTASRRRERVEDAPAAISVITKQDMFSPRNLLWGHLSLSGPQ